MKKTLCVFIVLLLTLSFISCKKSPESEKAIKNQLDKMAEDINNGKLDDAIAFFDDESKTKHEGDKEDRTVNKEYWKNYFTYLNKSYNEVSFSDVDVKAKNDKEAKAKAVLNGKSEKEDDLKSKVNMDLSFKPDIGWTINRFSEYD
jgi:hypothetical protein